MILYLKSAASSRTGDQASDTCVQSQRWTTKECQLNCRRDGRDRARYSGDCSHSSSWPLCYDGGGAPGAVGEERCHHSDRLLLRNELNGPFSRRGSQCLARRVQSNEADRRKAESRLLWSCSAAPGPARLCILYADPFGGEAHRKASPI